MKHRKSDILWKVVMEEVFDDLLRFIYPDADQVYDMERGFEFLEKELAEMYPEPDKASDTRFADKLVKVFHLDGEEEWVLIHVEIQGDTSHWRDFSERMFRYFYRILDRYKRPVSAIAFFTGQDGRKMPCRFEYTYRQTRLVYDYHAISILDFSDEELENSSNPFAQVALAAKTALLEGKIPFIERIYKPDKFNIMGVDEYIRWEAIEETKEEFVKNLLKGSDFPDEKIASLVGVTLEFVNEVKAELKIK